MPALTGMGALPRVGQIRPGFDPWIKPGVKRAHLIRAAPESITYQIADVITAMRAHHGFTLNTLLVDGDHKNDWLMQYQADLLGLSGDAQRCGRAVGDRRGTAGA